MEKLALLSTTVDSHEAATAMAKRLVESRKVACVQIDGPIESVYRWQGQVCQAAEYRLSCKTTPTLTEKVLAQILEYHSYQTPELLVQSIDASPEYFAWLVEQVSSED